MNSIYTGGNLCAHGFHQPCEEYHDSTKCKAGTLISIQNFVYDLRFTDLSEPIYVKYIFILSHEIFQHSVVHIKTQDYNIFFRLKRRAANLQFESYLQSWLLYTLITPPKTAGPLHWTVETSCISEVISCGCFSKYLKKV